MSYFMERVHEQVTLWSLRDHWGQAYYISTNRSQRRWTAVRRDTRTLLEAVTPEGLLDQIRADYTASPVPREYDAPTRERVEPITDPTQQGTVRPDWPVKAVPSPTRDDSSRDKG